MRRPDGFRGASMVSRKIARLFKKTFGIHDADAALDALVKAAETPGLSNDAKALLQNLPAFLNGIDTSFGEYDERLKDSARALDLSSRELSSSNIELEKLSITVKAMLESLGQGLLVFGEDGTCLPVSSKACLTLLEGDPAGRNIADVLRLDAEARSAFLPVISLMFGGDTMALTFDELAPLAPASYAHSAGLRIALSYRPMYNAAGNLMGVLVVATDVTQTAEAQEKLKAKELQVLRTLRIAGNRGNFVHLLGSFEAVFATFASAHSLSEVKRDLHTLKGMSNVFYLHDMARLLHELEDRIAHLPETGWQQGLRAIDTEYRTRIELGIDYVHWLGREIWGGDFETADDVISLDTTSLASFGTQLRQAVVAGATAGQIEKLFFEKVASQSVYSIMAFFETQLSYFAEVASKPLRIQHVAGDDVRIFGGFYRGFFDSLTHVARNIVDHAFEPSQIRELLGKPPELQVKIRIWYADAARESFCLSISDDGPGVSYEKVSQKLRSKNRHDVVDGKSHDDVIQHIFDEDFSTQGSATMDSGRGMGMNVVRREVEKLQGSLKIESREGQGATLVIKLPVLWRQPV